MKLLFQKQGFTLIEVLVSTTIFVLIIALGMTSYFRLSSILRQEYLQKQVTQEMMMIMEDIKRYCNEYEIDYAWYRSNENLQKTGNTTLVFLNPLKRERILMKLVSTGKTIILGNETKDVSVMGIYKESFDPIEQDFIPAPGFENLQFKAMNSDNVHIAQAHFFVFPIEQNAPMQAKVTVVFEGITPNPFGKRSISFALQNSFSIRAYENLFDEPVL